MITLYSTGCPKCVVLTKKLEKASIKYELCTDAATMQAKGITSVPALEVNGTIYGFKDAADLINRGELSC